MTDATPVEPAAPTGSNRDDHRVDTSLEPTTAELPVTVPTDPEASTVEPEAKRGALPFWLELPLLIGAALIVAVVIKTFLFQAFYIPSGSMKETLQINDRVFVNKIAYSIGDIAIGDVVVFDDPRTGFAQPDEGVVDAALRNLAESVGLATPQSEFIKRVVGLPGDSVELRANQLYVNGSMVDEPYLAPDALPPSSCPGSDFGPVEVPAESLFVMGHNRCHSSDGRAFGPIPIDDVVGKAFVIIWPPSRWGGL
ncbi:MAG: signal peptidase I [Acidimicrobiia bacterium]|nr:signal peptidase I [Acidimicrobiia bacterium]